MYNCTEAGWAYIYPIMKTMCPTGYYHNGFVAAHALGHMMYDYIRYIMCRSA